MVTAGKILTVLAITIALIALLALVARDWSPSNSTIVAADTAGVFATGVDMVMLL
jgi:hypothetical protein